MEQENGRVENERPVLELKLPEPEVTSDKPWQDDVLNRKDVADRLTNIIRNQTLPFVISIHGEWGTGKTFMLRRWQKDLENQGFVAIYFNAWEDDFCDDPLLAIVGQMWEHFDKMPTDNSKRFLQKVIGDPVPLLRANINSLLGRFLGLTIETSPAKENGRDLICEYRDQSKTKHELKKSLGEIAGAALEETGHPLVFIIDELDRCRPTFAIELLERVKHIFDVPNMVFVLGINRDELCKSLQSIYGEIKANVYLRRFFDVDFVLPEADSMRFCRYKMREFGIDRFFEDLVRYDMVGTGRKVTEDYCSFFPALWEQMELSLRDMDYCVRSMALLVNSLPSDARVFPWLHGLLITLRLKAPNLYLQFIQRDCLASQVLNYIRKELNSRQATNARMMERGMDLMEGYLYCAEDNVSRLVPSASSAIQQLELLKEGRDLTHPEYLSELTESPNSDRAGRLLQIAENAYYGGVYGDVIGKIAELIDLHQVPESR